MGSNFFVVPEHIFLDRSLSALEVKLWAYVHRFDRSKSGCFASDEHLAEVLGCHTQSLRRIRARLIERGYLRWSNVKNTLQRNLTAVSCEPKKGLKMPVDNLCITCGKLCRGSCGKLTKNTPPVPPIPEKPCSIPATNLVAQRLQTPVASRLQDEPVDNTRNYSKEIAKIVFDLSSIKRSIIKRSI
ncbi:MAG: helix-turn-helix domain-containing protein [Enterovibrio sp.]